MQETAQSTDAVVTYLTANGALENEIGELKQDKIDLEIEFNQILEARIKEHEEQTEKLVIILK